MQNIAHLLCRVAFLLTLFTPTTSGYTVAKHQECVASLVDVYGDLLFVGVGYGSYYDTVCGNPLAVASLHASAKIYCSSGDSADGFKLLKSACRDYSTNGTLLPESAVAVNLTDDAISKMKYIQLSDVDTGVNLTEPVLLSRELFRVTYRTEDDWDSMERLRRNYGYAMYGFWGGLLLIGMMQRLVIWLFESRRIRTPTDIEKALSGGHRASKILQSLATPYHWFRTYIITPSTLPPYRRELLFGCTVPTRLEFLVVFLCWAVNIVLCAVDIRGFTGNLYWSNVSVQSWRYISDRTGVISYANLPILWMFSGRNNIFIWATGWSFSTFNTYHKHVARIATLEGIIHSAGYTVFYYSYAGNWDNYIEEYQEQWFYLGVAATCAMSFLVLLSFSAIRSKGYETFLIIHIALAVVLLYCLFRHTSIFDGEYDPYIWTPVAIWCFDRFLRLVRLLYCNIHVYLHRGKSIHYTKATVFYDTDADRLGIDVVPANSSLKPGPGQHYYLYQPFRLTGWENHPLTLAAWKNVDSGLPAASTQRLSTTASCTSKPTLSFWIRPCDGWTRQLKSQCTKHVDNTMATTILLEGPYGKAEPLPDFDEILLIAGGSGISAVFPYLRDHMDRAENPQRMQRTTSITLVWADRSESYIRQHSTGTMARALSQQGIVTAFYNTSKTESNISESSQDFGPDANYISEETGVLSVSQSLSSGQVCINRGRPNVNAIIEKTATAARESTSRLAIYVCGPPGLADAARDAAYKAMKKDQHGVAYFEDAFSW